MAYSHVTITIDWIGNYIGASYNPSDASAAGIYPDATVLMNDNSGELIGGQGQFAIRSGALAAGSELYATYVAASGQQFSLASAFGSAVQPGRYLTFDPVSSVLIPIMMPYSHVGAPSAPSVAETVSREAVLLSWGAGSAGTNNAVTGYDVQYCDSADGVTFGSWQTASGSPVSGAQLSVSPPGSAGYYRKFRVRTRGSAGADWYSDWVESADMLRRKWDAFGAWTDSALVARSSMIRAVHLSEIQARVNVIRTFYGLGAYSFTPVTARAAKVAWWAALIQELRTAIDGISSDHEAWNTLEAGKPRIAHVAQLRRVIDAM